MSLPPPAPNSCREESVVYVKARECPSQPFVAVSLITWTGHSITADTGNNNYFALTKLPSILGKIDDISRRISM